MQWRKEKPSFYRPSLLLVYSDSAHAAQTARYFRRHGWEVHLAASGAESYRLVQQLKPRVTVVDTELPDESGWLACAKITLQHPDHEVVLLTSERSEECQARLANVGARALVARSEGVAALASHILGNHEHLAQAV